MLPNWPSTISVNLNQLLQQAINPSVTDRWGNITPELHRGGYMYRPGDKVMQIKNNYDKEVFNGDIGTIEKIDMEERTLVLGWRYGNIFDKNT